MSETPDYEAAARHRACRENIEFDLCDPEEQVKVLWDMLSDLEVVLRGELLYRSEPDVRHPEGGTMSRKRKICTSCGYPVNSLICWEECEWSPLEEEREAFGYERPGSDEVADPR